MIYVVMETLKTYKAGQFVVAISFDKESKHLQHLRLTYINNL